MPDDRDRKVLDFPRRKRPARGEHRIFQYEGRDPEQATDGDFPDKYRLHSTVLADDVRHAYALGLTQDFEDGSSGRCRFTNVGDVIVDPRGTAHRVTKGGLDAAFREIGDDLPTRPEAKALFAEWRNDYAARSEDPLAEARQRAKERAEDENKGPEIG